MSGPSSDEHIELPVRPSLTTDEEVGRPWSLSQRRWERGPDAAFTENLDAGRASPTTTLPAVRNGFVLVMMRPSSGPDTRTL